ncbi:MAG TPA: DUF1587 domain-containing protein, partial [Bryobacteraceae bacterium]|nr:DUF1587 domain-containing protein [Bryobacteraceae bacterium]
MKSLIFLIAAAAPALLGQQQPPAVRTFIAKNCAPCHNTNFKQSNLDLTTLPFHPSDSANFARWARIHDRVRDQEMPPIKSASLTPASREAFLKALEAPLMTADAARYVSQGRTLWRRMNRYEYEDTLRDLLGAPWLQVKELLPEDGEAYHFNKSGEALDVSHVQMSQYLSAAEYALRQALPHYTERPQVTTKRYYARDQNSMFSKVAFPASPERNMFPVVGDSADLGVLHKTGPRTVGPSNPEVREQEGLGVVASTYEPLEMRFQQFTAPVSGLYKLRL